MPDDGKLSVSSLMLSILAVFEVAPASVRESQALGRYLVRTGTTRSASKPHPDHCGSGAGGPVRHS